MPDNKSSKVFEVPIFFLFHGRKLWNSKKQFPVWRTHRYEHVRIASVQMNIYLAIKRNGGAWRIVHKQFRSSFKGNPFKWNNVIIFTLFVGRRTKKGQNTKLIFRQSQSSSICLLVCSLVALFCVLTNNCYDSLRSAHKSIQMWMCEHWTRSRPHNLWCVIRFTHIRIKIYVWWNPSHSLAMTLNWKWYAVQCTRL